MFLTTTYPPLIYTVYSLSWEVDFYIILFIITEEPHVDYRPVMSTAAMYNLVRPYGRLSVLF